MQMSLWASHLHSGFMSFDRQKLRQTNGPSQHTDSGQHTSCMASKASAVHLNGSGANMFVISLHCSSKQNGWALDSALQDP